MIVAKIKKISLKFMEADNVPKKDYDALVNWLNAGWSIDNNFKAVVAETKEEAIEKLSNYLYDELVPSWLKNVTPEMFEFEIAYSELEDGFFWINMLGNTTKFSVKKYY